MFEPPEPQLKRLLRNVSIWTMVVTALVLLSVQVFVDHAPFTARVMLTNGATYIVAVLALLLMMRWVMLRSKYRIDSTGLTVQYQQEGRKNEIKIKPEDIDKHYFSTRWLYARYGLVDLILVTKAFDIPIESISRDNADKILRYLKVTPDK